MIFFFLDLEDLPDLVESSVRLRIEGMAYRWTIFVQNTPRFGMEFSTTTNILINSKFERFNFEINS